MVGTWDGRTERRADGERVAVLEERMRHFEEKQDEMADDLKAIRSTLNDLVKRATMGDGAWLILLKIGSVFVFLSGVAMWAWDKVKP